MVSDGANGGQTARDFLALSHGHEWTNFYDSFDKLVQDNLARSSELLRHAMSLPEVADREVAEIKTEMAEKIAAERKLAQDAFASLQNEVLASQKQAEGLIASISTLVSDFSRLSAKIGDLVKSYEESGEAPSAEPVAVVEEPTVAEVENTWSAAAEEVEAEPAAAVETEEEISVNAESQESDELGWDSDVSFAEVVGGDAPESEDEDSAGSSPQRPAWLSVARQSAAS
jgi:hypothetical protein